MLHVSGKSCLLFIATICSINSLCADERTAIPREGLLVWLTAADVAELPSSDESKQPQVIARWPNRASDTIVPEQLDASKQPRLVQVGESHVVRFDGEDDHLRAFGPSNPAGSATIFIVCDPHVNPGDFRGMFAANAREEKDYSSGLTIDLGPGPSREFDQLNVEGRGFGGAADLLESSRPFGTLHVIQATADAAAKLVTLHVDGKAEGSRPFDSAGLSLAELTFGARFLNHGPGPQHMHGPFRGDLVELLLYDRALSEAEAAAVRTDLTQRYAKLAEVLPKSIELDRVIGDPLKLAADPPPIQMLVPGFDIRELPHELTNVNNVRFREDGKLVTVGYNGDIQLLTDTNGDGVEDKAEMFWKNTGSLRGPIGIVLTPPGYAKGRGLFVASKGKVSLIVDTNGDDKADDEIIVAQGWQEITQNVDAVGMAMDKDGNLFFGLGTANYANAYLIDDKGKAAYDIKSDRGTVQKVSADFSKRETVCTGIRFPIAFAFNEHGDLFCTEQEGATWLPNGNPFDELLHIRPDRHYGFPPRHPRHNPNVIDEPSTFDYGPQHQSTCGMVFNQPVNGGPIFGPESWRGDAIVCGESRGKIWRTKLVKSGDEYVAASQLLACLQMLTVDACVAPNGDLVVACHSGPPDWGTGPAGIGKLFRIRMIEPEAPRPVIAWAEGPQEIRIAFDRPLDPLQLAKLTDRVTVEYGDHVRAGDRFEHMRPPYAVVQAQSMLPRFRLPVTGATVTSDLRTMIVSTAPLTQGTHVAVTIANEAPASPGAPGLEQHPQMDVDFALHGLQAEWTPEGADQPTWSGWLPHMDLEISKLLLAGSAGHEPLWESLMKPGTLKMTTQLDLTNVLRPAVQPGATIDYEWPEEKAVLDIASSTWILDAKSESTAIDIFVPTANSVRREPGRFPFASVTAIAEIKEPCRVTLVVPTLDGAAPKLSISLSTNEDPRPRPFPLHRFILPWIDTSSQSSAAPAEPAKIVELDGGSWSRGRKVFRSEAAGCFKCHAVGGGAATIGPDLANLVHRDYRSVVRDVTNPSFAINPDYIAHTIVLNDGRVLTGVLQSDGDDLLVGDEKGQTTRIARADVETLQPSAVSVMPKGIADKVPADQMKDLLMFLLTKPPRMPEYPPIDEPPLRTQAEVAAVLAGAPEPPLPTRPINIVLVDGPKDHGLGEHDYPAWRSVWHELLSAADNVTVETASEFPSDEQLAVADVAIFFQKGSFDGERPAKLDGYLKRGGGAVYIHWAVNGNEEVREFSRRLGYASQGGKISYRHGPLDLQIHSTDHPIVRNLERLALYDESYWKLTGNPSDVTLLATSEEDGMATPQVWTRDHNPGRVFVSIPGHYSWTFDDPLFRILLLRGIAWTAKEPVDRFNDLAMIGARVSR